MGRKARVKLSGQDHEVISRIGKEICDIAKKAGVKVSGPIPLPTKRLKISTFTTPDGEGTLKWENWEKRIHKRIVDIGMDETVMRKIMRLEVPGDVHIEIEVISD